MTDLSEVERRAIYERIAKEFHQAYEELAPVFGYRTRKESAKPWKDVPPQNQLLMVAVVKALVEEDIIIPSSAREYSKQREEELQGGVIAALRILHDRTIGSPEACERASRALVAALAENGDNDG